jgi:hypothetical protein
VDEAFLLIIVPKMNVTETVGAKANYAVLLAWVGGAQIS